MADELACCCCGAPCAPPECFRAWRKAEVCLGPLCVDCRNAMAGTAIAYGRVGGRLQLVSVAICPAHPR